MVDRGTLEKMSKDSAAGVWADTLADLQDVKIEGKTPAQRLESFIVQTGNPYCVRVGRTPVRIFFCNEEKPLAEKLKAYFVSLKNSDEENVV